MKKTALVLGLLFITMASCKEAKKSMEKQDLNNLGGKYVVTELPGVTIGERAPHLLFNQQEGKVNGHTGCNAFFGKYAVGGEGLQFEDIASTEMACEPAIMEIEGKFLKALWESGKASLNNGYLTLYSKDDNELLLTAKHQKD